VRAIAPVLAGCALLLMSWLLLTHVGFWKHGQQVDTFIYQGYAANVLDGQVPYRDFQIEYPPAALPMFVLPQLGHPGPAAYRFRFEWLMALCALIAIVAVDVALRALDASDPARLGVLALVGVSPLILGPVVLSRFDFWPAALTVAGVAAFLRDRNRLGGAMLGLAAAAKFYPAAIVPVAIAYVWRRRGGAHALRSLAVFAGVFIACLLPFAILSPRGILHPFAVEVKRPLEVESLGGALLIAAHHVFGLKIGLLLQYTSLNLGGAEARLAEGFTTVVEVAALLWVWVACARRRLGPAEMVTGAAAAVSILLAFGKVFSPQYLIWLIPVVPLVEAPVRRAAILLLVAACALTQAWFPRHSGELLLYFRQPESWFLLARDLAVVALAVVLARSVAARRTPQSDP
jgi:Glycosyltransferase family 87